MKIVVIGGVAGGATAIARLRRLNEDAEIILLERGKYVSFANCGLPYYVGGVIPERDMLFVATPKTITDKYNIEVRTENEVKKINRKEKTIDVVDLKTGKKYQESYDKLLISTGSRPFVPPVSGVKAPRVFSLWTIADVDAITEFIEKENPKKAVVVGGGFIGLEMAENLVERGIDVTIVEMANQVMPPVDEDMAKIVQNHMISKGVKLMLGKGFAGTEDEGRTLLLNSGEKLDTDMVVLSIGVRPNNELAKEAGLKLSERGGIVTDDFLQTSDPNIYAVGDVTAVEDYVLSGPTMIPLAGPANKQGRAVGANMLGLTKEGYEGTMGTSIAQIFDVAVAAVGSNEKILNRKGLVYKKDYFVTVIHPNAHAGYYPGSLPMTIKLIFGKDGEIFGAQIVGYDGVDKRIDVIATAMRFRGTVADLSQLELAYAPPYNTAKDPVNYAGYTAMNILNGLANPVLVKEYLENKDEYVLLDVREDEELMVHKYDEAKHIPLSQLRKRYEELDKSKHYLAMCSVGLRGYVSSRILTQKGYKVSYLVGGTASYNELTAEPEPPTQVGGGASASGAVAAGAAAAVAAGAGAVAAAKVEGGKADASPAGKVKLLNVCGLSCPGPIVQVAKGMEELNEGDILEVEATDPGFARDIESWCVNTGNTMLELNSTKGKIEARIQKGAADAAALSDASKGTCCTGGGKEKTMIIFDGDLDKAIASFIIATGAAAMGNKVHMFFTFWGLSVIRKPEKIAVKKDFMGKMFGKMLPRGSKKLSLSKMNFMGMGPKMIRNVMKKKGITSLEELIKQALDMGVEITACQMTMDIMGLTKEELIDGVKIGGVATMLNDNDKSNMNLFI